MLVASGKCLNWKAAAMLIFISFSYYIYANNIDSWRAGYKLRSAVSSGTRLILLLHSVHMKDT